MVTLLTALVWSQQKKEWKDRAEFDLYNEMANEKDPAKRVDKIKAWREKYPESQFKKEGLMVQLTTYVQLNKPAELMSTAKEILAMDPLDVTSLFYLTSMTITNNNTAADALETGEKAAQKLAFEGDKVFAADRRPQTSTEEQWKKAKDDMEILGLRTLGWIEMTRKDNDKAEATFKKLLEKSPNEGQVAYWLYTMIRAKPTRSSEALFYLAKAASIPQDKSGFTAAQQKQIDDFFLKAYSNYHGQDDEGMKELRKLSLATATPPEGFKIRTAAEISVEKEEQFKKSNPQLAFWMHLKGELTGANGEKFYEDTLKGAGLPGKIEGTEFTKLKGKVVSHKPAANPKEVVLLMDPSQNIAGSSGEVTLKFETPLRGKADPGTELEFEGIASGFTKDPFMLTFDVDKEKLVGWPAQAAAPPAKKSGGARKGVTKKK
ncbi:MAG TPA: hypothetical protein VM120_27790 [Bryobacteraceae bacterium]|nr:hypothetical protein [Bryobacteraceae bacterium]